MKRLIALLSLCVCAFATQITGPIKTPYGTGWSGDILIDCPSGVNAAGDVIRRWAMKVSVVNGIVNPPTGYVDIDPGDAGQPTGRRCSATYRPSNGGQTWPETWLVPTSASPLKVSQIQVGNAPAPPTPIQPSQIARSGATTGQALVWNGASWLPANAVAGSAAWGGITGGDPLQQPDLAALFGAKLTTPSGSGIVAVTSGTPGLVAGTSTDCVRVDGTSGPCGTGTGGGYGQTWDSLSAVGTTWDAL